MDTVEELAGELRRRGLAQRRVGTEVDAVEWRNRAREAAHRLDRPVQTMQGGLVVLAVLKDWPANELERELTELQVANAIKRMRIPVPTEAPGASQ